MIMKIITKGMFIKHDRFMDVCIYLDKSPILLPDDRYIVRGVFWNMGFVDSFGLGIKFSRKITLEDLKTNYSATIARHQDRCLRKNYWVRL
jgi:hypothetical protein